MQFSYYQRLTARERAVYRASDRVSELPLPHPAQLGALAAELEEAYDAGQREAVQQAALRLCRQITRSLRVPPVEVQVHEYRPRHGAGDTHGAYTRRPRRRPHIQLWLRPAAQRQVVAFRTFLRTLLHELCHHLDYHHLRLPHSFHTQGFYQRESSLLRQLTEPPSAEAPAVPVPLFGAAGRRPRR